MSGKSCGLVERSVGRDGAWGSGAWLAEKERSWGRSICCGGSANLEYMSRCFGRRKLRSVIMAREQAELWKTRDNGGKAAWLFIGVLSSVYWVSDGDYWWWIGCVNYARVLLPKLVCETITYNKLILDAINRLDSTNIYIYIIYIYT